MCIRRVGVLASARRISASSTILLGLTISLASSWTVSSNRFPHQPLKSLHAIRQRPEKPSQTFAFAMASSSSSSSAAQGEATRKSATSTRLITGLREIADSYDGFILDQYGVIHNGAVALPGAVECFNELIAAKKKIVILSNTSRRAKDAKGKLPGLGFDLELITGLVCSGEEAWKHMKSEFGGRRCTWLTWEREEEAKGKGDGFLEGLDVTTADVEDADFILCHGSDIILGAGSAEMTNFQSKGDVSKYSHVLKRGVERRLPMICANPDERAMLPDGTLGHMPGAIAAEYSRLGGQVVMFGKPDRKHFDASKSLLTSSIAADAASTGHAAPWVRFLHVGDSLHHDIAGASNAEVDSLFIGGGIHASALGLGEGGGGELEDARVFELQEKVGIKATYASRLFVW